MTSQMIFSRRLKVLIVSSDQVASEFMQSSLSALSQYDSEVVPLNSVLNRRAEAESAEFDLLVLDAGDGTILEGGAAQKIRDRFAELPLIVVSEPLPDDRIRLLLRLNGSDWLKKPLERKTFLESVTGNVQQAPVSRNQVHAVISAAGGVGGTSVAVSLADALARTRRKTAPSVMLLDLDFSVGACGSYLNTPNDYDLQPVIDNPSRIDLEFIDIIRKKHERGFSLLSFKQPAVNLASNGRELVLRMLDVVSFQNEHTVVDVPYYETAWKEELLAAVNNIYLVTELTIPSLHQAKAIYNRIRATRSGDVVRIVANKHRTKVFGFNIGKKNTRRVFKDTKTLTVVEDDWSTMSEAVNRGILPIEVNRRSPFVREIEKLAELVRQ